MRTSISNIAPVIAQYIVNEVDKKQLTHVFIKNIRVNLKESIWAKFRSNGTNIAGLSENRLKLSYM